MTDASEELIADIREVFSLFDKDGDNKIKTESLGLLVRALNQNPTEQEVEEMKAEIDPENTGEMNFSDVVALVLRRWKEVDGEEELLDAFRMLKDKGKSVMNSVPTYSAEDLKYGLTQSGEKLTEQEIVSLLKIANPNVEGEIDYEEFARIITSRYV
jgi:calmodulin